MSASAVNQRLYVWRTSAMLIALHSVIAVSLNAQSPYGARVLLGPSTVFSRAGVAGSIDLLVVSKLIGSSLRAGLGASFLYSENATRADAERRITMGAGTMGEISTTGRARLFGQVGIGYLRTSIPDLVLLDDAGDFNPEDTPGARNGLGLSGAIGTEFKVAPKLSLVAKFEVIHQSLLAGANQWWHVVQFGIQLDQ